MKRTGIALALAALVFTGLCCRGTAPHASSGAQPAAAAHGIPEKDIFTITSPGRWFPADKDELRAAVDGYLAGADKKELPGRIVALVSPHAGYPFSGPVAAWAYRQIQGLEFDTVVVVGFRHAPGFDHVATVTTGGFRTPLGVIPIDTATAAALTAESDLIRNTPQAFDGEHSLDTQLPFLQRALSGFKLVPVLLCSQSQANIDALAAALQKTLKGKNALLVASTDMSHFWSHEQARLLDEQVLAPVLALDADALGSLMNDDPTGRRMCGRGAVQAVMRAARALGADQASLLKYADSKDTSGYDDPRNGVVGYAAVAFTQSGADNVKAQAPGELDAAARDELLKIARRTLETFVKTGRAPDPSSASPALLAKSGAFVTLNKNGELRGCMGRFERDLPLTQVIARQTMVSASQDPRFPPVTPDELDAITIEISVLSAPAPVPSYEDIEVGRHGVILRKGGRGATFLPQVAPEQGWTRDQMLTQLALKAGLPADAWKHGATFEVYTAQVFGEH